MELVALKKLIIINYYCGITALFERQRPRAGMRISALVAQYKIRYFIKNTLNHH